MIEFGNENKFKKDEPIYSSLPIKTKFEGTKENYKTCKNSLMQLLFGIKIVTTIADIKFLSDITWSA